jgi:hypothetical protein
MGFDPTIDPHQKIVLQFDFRGLTKGRKTQRSYWVVMEAGEVDMCLKDPGFAVDVFISADLSAFTHVWMGYAPLDLALKQGKIALEGDRDLVRQVHGWLCRNGERLYGTGTENIDPTPSFVTAMLH